MTVILVEPTNPPKASVAPYIYMTVAICIATITGVVVVVVARPGADNAGLVTQILGFATTTLMATLAYMRSTETREVVNSRMDEFKRVVQTASDIAQNQAHTQGRIEGQAEGREAANKRTDTLSDKPLP